MCEVAEMYPDTYFVSIEGDQGNGENVASYQLKCQESAYVIGMLAARRAGQVRGVELVRDAVACAQTVARVNRISNIDFICADAVNAMRDDDFVPTVVFVDPPRAGCDARFLRSLSHAAPERIVYVSCCPETLRRDVDILQASGYALQSAQPVDLFPYTAHTEAVVLLSRMPS